MSGYKRIGDDTKEISPAVKNGFVVAALIITSLLAFGFSLGTLIAVTSSNSAPLQIPQNPGSCGEVRRTQAYSIRLTAAIDNYVHPVPCHVNNGDEALYADRRAQYSKSLPHDPTTGLVNPAAYQQLLNAANSGNFDNVQLAPNATNKLTNPLGGLAFDLIGGDSHSFAIPPAPTFNSAEQAAEYVELSWLSLSRDVPFDQYGLEPITVGAITELNNLTDYKAHLPVNASNLYRAPWKGCDIGPYISQFFYQPCYYGPNHIDMKLPVMTPGINFMTNMTTWLNIQNGGTAIETETYLNTTRYIITGRDLGSFVKKDMLFQSYHQAAMILLDTLHAPYNPTNPYLNSLNQQGFSSFGPPHVSTLVTEVATRALHAAWFQKWFVNRRLRPEAFGARVDRTKKGIFNFNIHPQALNSNVGSILNATYGGYFIPQQYASGAPTHPSYAAGHSTVSGACITILKAMFDGNYIIPTPLVPNANGSTTVPYVGPPLTVEHELNKLSANVGIGRNHASVHFYSDNYASAKLGEQIAITTLRDYKKTFAEPFVGWKFNDLDGNPVFI